MRQVPTSQAPAASEAYAPTLPAMHQASTAGSDALAAATPGDFGFSPGLDDTLSPGILDVFDPGLLDMDHVADMFDFWTTATSARHSPQALHADPVDAERSIDTMNGMAAQVIGATGDLEPCLLQQYRFDESNRFRFQRLTIQSVQHGRDPLQFLLSDISLLTPGKSEIGHNQLDFDRLGSSLEAAVPAKHGTILVKLFQFYVAPCLPIFSAEQPPNVCTSPPYLLAAIYLCTQQFAKLDDSLGVELAYEPAPTAELIRIASVVLSSTMHTPNIQVLQTLLLLVIRPSTSSAVTEAPYRWSLLGHLVACSQTLGLQYDASKWPDSVAQRNMRRRISFLVYAIDKWMACGLGRPPLISRENWMIDNLEIDSLKDSGLREQQSSCLIAMSDLTTILSKVLSDL